MAISVGEKLPESKLVYVGADGPDQITTSDLFGGKKVVMFAVTGAFTPTCNANHLPGFIAKAEEILAKGVDEIAVISVNDIHVMSSWAEASGGKGKIRFIADGSANYTKEIGMDIDLSEVGMGVRSLRFSMIVEDGVVTTLNAGDGPGQATIAGAETILTQL